MNLDLSKTYGPDCISGVALKNCEPKLSYIINWTFWYEWKSCFPGCWKVSSVVPIFKNVRESSTTKNHYPSSLLSVSNRILNHLEKCDLSADFQYGFRSSSTADLLTVVFDKIARAFNRSWVTQAVALDISKAFNRVCMPVFFTELILMEFQVRYLVLFLLFSVVGCFGWFYMGSLHKSIQLMLEFLRGPFLVWHFSYHALVTFLMMLYVILLSMLLIALYSKCDQVSELWWQLESASEPESDLRDTVD